MSIYTIGHEGEYDAAIARARDQEAPLTKRGPHPEPDGSHYYGGYAFATVADAQAEIDRLGKRGEWAVYAIDAAWPEDVWHGHPSDSFMRLNRDAVIIGKVTQTEAAVERPAARLVGVDQRKA
jgi:hypothetical protein